MAKLNARKIVAGLKAEVDEARDAMCNEVLTDDKATIESLRPLINDYREKLARLDKALGQ